jgi:hypothetical protein
MTEDHLAEGLANRTKETLQLGWKMLRQVELMLAKAAQEFAGVDPAQPEERHSLDCVRALPFDYHGQIQGENGKFDLPEPL